VGVGREANDSLPTNEHSSSDLFRVGVINKTSWQDLEILTLNKLITKAKLPKREEQLNRLVKVHELI
jgi:hypothetical protein